MRIVIIAFATLACLTTEVFCHEHDFSKTQRYSMVWSLALDSVNTYGVASQPVRFQQFGGTEAELVVLSTRARGTVSWTVSPLIDTISRLVWPPKTNIHDLKQIDYDGVPPLEFITVSGVVWTIEDRNGVYSLRATDTIPGIDAIAFQSSGDFDGDGYLDAVFNSRWSMTGLGSANSIRVIRGGPAAGKGPERLLRVEPPQNKLHNWVRKVWRSGDGRWKILIDETNEDVLQNMPHDSSRLYPLWLTMYEMKFSQQSGSATFKKLDSLTGEGYRDYEHSYGLFGNVEVLVDTVEKCDHFFVYNHEFGVQRVSIANDKFVSERGASGSVRGVKDDIAYALNPTAYMFSASIGPLNSPLREETLVLYRVDSLDQPQAIVWVNGKVNMCVVSDQTGDGIADILVMAVSATGQHSANLMSLDTTKRAYAGGEGGHATPEARMIGASLEVTLDRADDLSVDITSLDGKVYAVPNYVHGRVGTNLYDLEPILGTAPPGLYLVRVKTSAATTSIGYVR